MANEIKAAQALIDMGVQVEHPEQTTHIEIDRVEDLKVYGTIYRVFKCGGEEFAAKLKMDGTPLPVILEMTAGQAVINHNSGLRAKGDALGETALALYPDRRVEKTLLDFANTTTKVTGEEVKEALFDLMDAGYTKAEIKAMDDQEIVQAYRKLKANNNQ